MSRLSNRAHSDPFSVGAAPPPYSPADTVGTGVIGEMSTGYPGYDSVIHKDKATIGTILRDNGYSTSWFGKNHNTPGYQYSSQAGPLVSPPMNP